jgi:pimeloyl-ACP methyl ester carboxylesterase
MEVLDRMPEKARFEFGRDGKYMKKITRRDFIAQTATLAAGASTLATDAHAHPQPATAAVDATDKRREALDVLLKILPRRQVEITGRMNAHDKSWEDWLKRTGELPPDFDAMPSTPFLVDPLEGVQTRGQWKQKRQEIRAQFEQWVFGKMPPQPDNLRSVITESETDGKLTIRDVRLEFGPDHRGTLRVQLIIPPGKGPFPVFLTNHPRTWPWVATAVRRGYMGCIYFAGDPIFGPTDDSDRFIDVYPEFDFSCMARWAWAGMRAVDYLQTLPEVDKQKIAIAGHSRNGKQALLAAAFDDRIAAVIASSGNTGECDPWRYTTDMFVNESIEQITGVFPHWFHPRLRFFAGREHKLPVDQHALMAMVAPRGLFMYSAYTEQEGNSFGFEHAFPHVEKVYRFLGHEDKVWMNLREGEHSTTAEDIGIFCDFLDTLFGRQTYPRREVWVNGYTFEQWKKTETLNLSKFPSADQRDLAAHWSDATRQAILQKINWAMGDEPPGVRFPVRHELQGAVMADGGWVSLVLGRPFKNPLMGAVGLGYGDDLKADFYFPIDADGSPRGSHWPVVVWMHPYSYPTGYSRDTQPFFASLIQRGFAVLAFDQIGFGTRVRDARFFCQRYPKWSLLGKMVTDTRAAVDAVAALEAVDSSRIYLVGYALGAKVGLVTAALDERVKGVAAVCGVDPLRLSRAEKGTEGVQHYSHLHGLLPRLGFFVGQESRLPFDFDEVLAAIAPRRTLIVAPTLDRYAPVADVQFEVEQSRKVYTRLGNEDALQLQMPLAFNSFTPSMEEAVVNWLDGALV